MRFNVPPSSTVAKALRATLAYKGYALGSFGPFVITIDITDGPDHYIVLDGIDSEFERLALKHISTLARDDIIVRLGDIGEVQQDRRLGVLVPPNEQLGAAVESGLFRAIEEFSKLGVQTTLDRATTIGLKAAAAAAMLAGIVFAVAKLI